VEGNSLIVEILSIVDKSEIVDDDQRERVHKFPLRDIPMLYRTHKYVTINKLQVITAILVFNAAVFETFQLPYLVGATGVFACFEEHDFFAHPLSTDGLSIEDMLRPQSLVYDSYRFRIRLNDAFQKALKDANGHPKTMNFSLSASAKQFADFLEFNSGKDIVHEGPAVENVRNETVMGSAHYSHHACPRGRFYAFPAFSSLAPPHSSYLPPFILTHDLL
jgi:hypothetical protein